MIDDQFDKWTDQWEKAQKDGIFNDAPKPPVPNEQHYADDFFGNHRPKADSSIRDVDAEYWSKVYRLSSNANDTPDPLEDDENAALTGDDVMAPINEEDEGTQQLGTKGLLRTTKADGKSVAKITDDLGGLANPVHGSTRGQDTRNRVTPNWAGGDDLIELHNMKISLEKLESKLNGADGTFSMNGMSKQAQAIQTQIDNLREKIDALSSSLNPEFRQEYLS